jgi:molecular chaperone GrpE
LSSVQESEQGMSAQFDMGSDLEAAMAKALESVERIEAERKGDKPPAAKPPEESAEDPSLKYRQGWQDIGEAEEEDEVSAVRKHLLRLAADFDNFRKNARKEISKVREFGNEQLFLSLLPIVDNLERALEHHDGEKLQWVEGVEIILKQFTEVLESFGVVSFSCLGEVFDPEKHEAVEKVPARDVKSGLIVEEFAKGYMQHNELLRPAKVVVAMAGIVENNTTDLEGIETLAEILDDDGEFE